MMKEKKKNFFGVLVVIAVLVVFAGFVVSNRNGLESAQAKASESATESELIDATGEIQEINSEMDSYFYPEITVKKGVPVRWIITAEEADLNFCNNKISIPGLGITKSLTAGENVIEFTPTESGTIPYSCWMGMIQSKITVLENGDTVLETPEPDTAEDVEESETGLPAAGGCCGAGSL